MKKELTPAGIFRSLGKCWWICVFFALVFAAGAFFYSQYNYRPAYTSRAQLMIRFSEESQSSSASSAVQGANYAQKMINTYISIFKNSNEFKNYVKATYLENFDTEVFPRYSANFASEDETQLVEIRITAYKPEYAYQLCAAYVECAPKYIADRTGKADELLVTDNATMPNTPSNRDNSARNTIIAALLGFLLPFAINVVVDLFDVRILTAEDLRNTYHYPVLGEIPDFERYTSKSKRRGYGYGYGYSGYSRGYGYGYGYGYDYAAAQKKAPTEQKTEGK